MLRPRPKFQFGRNKLLVLGLDTNEGQAEGDLFGAYGDARQSDGAPKFSDRRRPGRPKGSINKRTRAIVDDIVTRFGDPLVNLAEMNALDIPNIAKALACTKLEAAKIYIGLNETLATYVHSKRPTGVVVKVDEVAPLTIILPSEPDEGRGDGALIINPVKTIAYEDEASSVAQEGVARDS